MSPESAPPPLPPTPPMFTPPPPPMKPEQALVVIDKLNRKTGVFSKQSFRLVVTDQQLIFALQEKNGVDYLRQDPAITLTENPPNFAIPLDQVNIIEVYRGDFEDNTPDSLVVKTISEKMTFTISNAYAVSNQLKKVLGSKVK